MLFSLKTTSRIDIIDKFQSYCLAKIRNEFQINTTTQYGQENAVITPLTNGNFVVAWHSEEGNTTGNWGQNLKAQIFDSSGNKIETEFTVNVHTSNSQNLPNIAATSDGGFVLAWESEEQVVSHDVIVIRKFDASLDVSLTNFEVLSGPFQGFFRALSGLFQGSFRALLDFFEGLSKLL